MGRIVPIVVLLLILAAAWVFVQRSRAVRRVRLLNETLRLARSQGALVLGDVCRALAVPPSLAEELLAVLVAAGHLRVESTAAGGQRWRPTEPLVPPESSSDLVQ